MTHREVPAGVKQMTPVQAMYHYMREQNAVLEEERAKSQAAQKKAETTVREMALALNNFRRNQNEWTENTKRVFQTVESALQKNGVEIIDYTGRTIDDELLDLIKIEGWEPSDLSADTVKETFIPEIRWNGNLLHQAQVFCLSAKEEVREEEKQEEKIEEKAAADNNIETEPEMNAEPAGQTEQPVETVSLPRRIIEKIKLMFKKNK